MTKSEALREAVIDFEESDNTTSDYLELFYTAHHCMKQGSGLSWADVRTIIEETLKYIDNAIS